MVVITNKPFKVALKSSGDLTCTLMACRFKLIYDPNQITDGTATGVMPALPVKNIRVKFDDFKVYKY